ncbi:MAG TPA: serine hydrolase domain-containing protein [Acidimicrobiia bacterium]|nr:serine hydrolase domain-containing protein [Acidimicrobiia bacterium]
MTVRGTCDPRFELVHAAFERNFAARGEVGASVCVTVDGETVVDLWGGTADPATGRPWERDTIGVVWSCTKGATALCAHMLAGRGQLDLAAPVAQYWPEFAQGGKEAITVAMLLSHQAGLPAFREPIPDEGYCDWEFVVDRLAAEEPFWQPGTRNGYHALTFGHLIGEVVRRVSGQRIGEFFQTQVAGPLGLDFWMSLPADLEDRVAPTIPALPGPDDVLPSFYQAALTDPQSLAAMVLMHSGLALAPGWIDTRNAHAAELPAFGGIANARALAGMYAPLANGGGELVTAEQLSAMSAVVSATARDATVLVPTRWSLGFVKSIDNRRQNPGDQDGVVLSEDAFGHAGMGGSLGFCDPRARLSFGYTMNRQGLTVGIDERGQSLVDAVYSTLDYRRPGRGGSWFPA